MSLLRLFFLLSWLLPLGKVRIQPWPLGGGDFVPLDNFVTNALPAEYAHACAPEKPLTGSGWRECRETKIKGEAVFGVGCETVSHSEFS